MDVKRWLICLAALGCGAAPAADKLAPGPHEAALGDVTLHYVVAGHGTPVLVPSPGWGPGSLYLQRGLEPLEADHRLVFIDSRGSGGSSRPVDERCMGLDDMADDIDHMRAYLGITRLDLVGHSLSGAAAIEFAERYPDHLGRLVLLDAATIGDSAGDHAEEAQGKRDMARLAGDPRYAEALHHMMTDAEPKDDAAMMQFLTRTGALDFADPARSGPIFAKTIAGMAPSAFAYRTSFAADRAGAYNQERLLGRIRSPVLIVHGRQDWLVPVLTAEHIHADVAGSQLLLLDGCGHFPWIEQPAPFFPAVERFLAGKTSS